MVKYPRSRSLTRSNKADRWHTGQSVPLSTNGEIMRVILPLLAASLMVACGDKDEEDTAADTAYSAAEDTAAE